MKKAYVIQFKAWGWEENYVSEEIMSLDKQTSTDIFNGLKVILERYLPQRIEFKHDFLEKDYERAHTHNRKKHEHFSREITNFLDAWGISPVPEDLKYIFSFIMEGILCNGQSYCIIERDLI